MKQFVYFVLLALTSCKSTELFIKKKYITGVYRNANNISTDFIIDKSKWLLTIHANEITRQFEIRNTSGNKKYIESHIDLYIANIMVARLILNTKFFKCVHGNCMALFGVNNNSKIAIITQGKNYF